MMEEQVEVQAPPVIPQPASLLQRFGGCALDYLVFRMLYGFMPLSVKTYSKALYHWGFVLLFLAYYFLFEWALQRTPGKILTGTVVRGLDGSRPSATSIAVRTLRRCVPWDPFTVFRKDRSMLHDQTSLTLVESTGLLQRCKLRTAIAASIYGVLWLWLAGCSPNVANGAAWLGLPTFAAGMMWIALVDRRLWAWWGLLAFSVTGFVLIAGSGFLLPHDGDLLLVSLVSVAIGILPLWILLTDRPSKPPPRVAQPDDSCERLTRR
jgi:hypothetical protein